MDKDMRDVVALGLSKTKEIVLKEPDTLSKKRSAPNELQLASIPLSPPPQKKVKKAVLEEEKYIECLDQIIQRDYFPDLPKLRNQLEWLEAEKNKDFGKMREIQLRLRKGRDPKATPGNGSFETPSNFTPGDHLATPGSRPPSTPSSSMAAMPTGDTAQGSADGTPSIELSSLDKFQMRYTSEDNASFESILEKQNLVHKESHPWLWDKEKESQGLLTGVEKSEGTIQSWTYVAKNKLMYIPDGAPMSLAEEKEAAKGAPKQIARDSTRFHGTMAHQLPTPDSSKDAKKEALQALMEKDPERAMYLQRKMAKDGKVDLDELRGFKKAPASPQVRGYGFMLTPSPAPGVDASPFTTWGNIEGTPMLLDLQTPLSFGEGPTFKIPGTPHREKLLMELNEQSSYKKKKGPATPIASPLRSPMSSPLSADMQLRASYASPSHKFAARTPSQRPSASPYKTATPSPRAGKVSARVPSSPVPLKVSKPKQPASSSVATASSSSSLTDGLLKI